MTSSADRPSDRRIASPEMLLSADLLPHVICSLPVVDGEGGIELISMATPDELVVAVAGWYAQASRLERGRILNEFVAAIGLHRKLAMRLPQPAPDR